MDTVGLRDLKNNLSRHLQRVRQGKRLIVTDRGKSIAVIAPAPSDRRPAGRGMDLAARERRESHMERRQAAGVGGKPPAVAERPTLSDMVIEDRR